MTDLAAEVSSRPTGVLSLGLALSPMPWRAALHRHCRDHEAEVAVRLLTDGSRLLDGGDAGLDVVVVDDSTSWLSPSLVRRLAGRGVAVLGLFDPDEVDGHGRRLLARAGVAAVAEATLGSDSLVALARNLRPDPEVTATFDALVSGAFTETPAVAGPVIAVGGPAGVGATEVAIAVAAALADRSGSSGAPVLLEADERRPRLARRLGMALHPNLLTACDLIEGRPAGLTDGLGLVVGAPGSSDLDLAPDLDLDVAERGQSGLGAAFARRSVQRRPLDAGVEPRFDVVVGLAARTDWPQLRADEVGAVVAELSEDGRSVVAKVGSELGAIASAPGRWATSRTVLGRADVVVAVAEASPMGLLDLVDWLRDAVEVVADEAVLCVVLNRARNGRAERDRLRREGERLLSPRAEWIGVAGHDPHVARAAWDAEVASGGELRSLVEDLADRLRPGGR